MRLALPSPRSARLLHNLLPALLLMALAAGCGDDSSDGGIGGELGGGGIVGKGGSGGAGGDPGEGGGGGDEFPSEAPTFISPKIGLEPHQLAILVNDQDPQSVEVAAYYQERRGVPAENVIHLSFPVTGSTNISQASFAAYFGEALANTPATIQAYAVSWTYPSRVDCMSMTSAIAFGGFSFDYCNTAVGCGPTEASPYYGSSSLAPYDDFEIRPTMMLAGESVDEVKALIDRGIAADDTHPLGDGWLVETTDSARNVRFSLPEGQGGRQHEIIQSALGHEDGLRLNFVDALQSGSNVVEDQEDVLFYFTGLSAVPSIETNTYLPGAVADHLTSFGGAIPPRGQMNVLEWLQAGATASYGTVVEPCNYPTKFAFIPLLIGNYFRGATVVEAYWKSVAWPGEGLFVGEPLANPWKSARVDYDAETKTLQIETTALSPDEVWQLESAPSEEGPWTAVLGTIQVARFGRHIISLENATEPYYRLQPR